MAFSNERNISMPYKNQWNNKAIKLVKQSWKHMRLCVNIAFITRSSAQALLTYARSLQCLDRYVKYQLTTSYAIEICQSMTQLMTRHKLLVDACDVWAGDCELGFVQAWQFAWGDPRFPRCWSISLYPHLNHILPDDISQRTPFCFRRCDICGLMCHELMVSWAY
jgi:hypothetical protein